MVEMTVPGSFYEFISRDVITGFRRGRSASTWRFDHVSSQATSR